MKAWLNGKLVPAEDVTVPLLCHSFSRGSGIFEVLDIAKAAKGPAAFRLPAHVDRFFNSARLLHMPLPLKKEELIGAVIETVTANGPRPCAVKFFAYYAAVELGLIPRDKNVSIAIFCYDYGDPEDLATPFAVGISSVIRSSPRASAVHAKACGHYVSAFLAKWEAVEKGYGDAIMLDESGFIAEGSLSNVFFVKGGRVRTPPLRNVLPGITRDSVMEVIRGLNLPLEEADITPEEAKASDEGFFTGSTIRVKPLTAIDGVKLGRSCPGPVTKKISAALNDAYEGRDPKRGSWLTFIR